jgi:pimeloyl-ACP methyl ester carboxylesterase
MKTKNQIIFLSGLLCDETVWEDIKKELEDDFDITMISFKGCDSIENMAKKVLENSPNEFILIGHSMGGRVALEVYNQNSKRVKALGLFNTGVTPKSEAEVPGLQKLLDISNSEGIEAVLKLWLPPMMSKSGLENSDLMSKLGDMVKTYNSQEFSKQINALLNRPDAREVLPKVDVPVLLLSGTEDTWSPISQHKDMQEYLKNSELAIINEASHMAPCEQPKQVATAIKNWLSKNLKG